jgi:hypothetical protein
MSKQLMISMLKQGNNGEQILQILDTIVAPDDSSDAEPTLEEIQF